MSHMWLSLFAQQGTWHCILFLANRRSDLRLEPVLNVDSLKMQKNVYNAGETHTMKLPCSRHQNLELAVDDFDMEINLEQSSCTSLSNGIAENQPGDDQDVG